eukprot:229671_1
MESLFIKCNPWFWCTENLYSNVVAQTDQEFILCPDTTTLHFDIVEYNTKNNKWDDFFKINSQISEYNTFKSYHNLIALNKKKQLLYVYNSDCKLIVIDLNTKGFMQRQAKSKYNGESGSCLVINNEFHLFGGHTHRRHFIWNSTVGTFKK